MPRCPTCHRRLGPDTPCPTDGAIAERAPPPPPADPPALPNLRVTFRLGAGGFGTVWEALGPDGMAVAIKVAHEAAAALSARFDREAAALERIGAPWVPALHTSGRLPDGRAYLVMERIAAPTLADELARCTEPTPLTRVGEIITALCASLSQAHAAGLIHRDLKPDNIFLVGQQPLTACLVDFGLTRPTELGGGTELTRGRVVGTAEYMAPEQLAGAPGIDHRADIYALGVILFELVTLRPPFSGGWAAIEEGHLSRRPPRLSRFVPVPDALEAVVQRALAKDPARRFSDVEQLGAALAAAVGEAPDRPVDPAPPPSASHRHDAAPATPTAERQTVLCLFFHAADGEAVRPILQTHGGELAHSSWRECVGVFTYQAGPRPSRRALAAARDLCQRNLTERVLIDLSPATLRPRPDGSPRVLSSRFFQHQHYPDASQPLGVLLTADAQALLPEVAAEPVATRRGCFRVAPAGEPCQEPAPTTHDLPPLHGRAAILGELAAHASTACRERRPFLATVVGEPGFGKSHLARVLARRLTRTDELRVVELAAREPVGGDADGVLRALIERGLELDSAAPEGAEARLCARFGQERGRELYEGAALALGWLRPDDPALEALRAAPGALGARSAQTAATALGELARRSPVCVLVDDAQWIDDIALDAIELAADEPDAPLFLCVLARPELERGRPSWGERALAHCSWRLEALDRPSAFALCRQLLQPVDKIPDAVLARLVERTGSTPYLLVELLTGLKRDGLIRRHEGGSWYLATEMLDDLPNLPLLEWLARRELDRLPPALAAYARVLALCAPELAAEELEGILDVLDRHSTALELYDPQVVLRRLTASGLLIVRRSGLHGFRHALLRDAIAAGASPELGAELHRAAASYYRDATTLPEAIRLSRLAWHAAHAGAHAEAARSYLVLADLARARDAYLDAELLYSRALDLPGALGEAERLHAFRHRGDMRYRIGRYADSLADFDEARRLAEQAGERLTLAEIRLDEALALDWMLEFPRSRQAIEEAARLLEAGSRPLLDARLSLMRGCSACRFNEDAAALPLLEEAVRRAEPLGAAAYEVWVGANLLLGGYYAVLGRTGESQAVFERLEAACLARGDERHLSAVVANRTYLWIALDDRPRLEADLRRTIEYARRIGVSLTERHAQINYACYLYWTSALEAADEHARRAIDLDERQFRQVVRPEGRLLRARIALAHGDRARAAELVGEIRRHQAQAQAEGRSEALLLPLEQVLCDMVTLALDGAGDDAWNGLVQRARAITLGQELIEILDVRARTAFQDGSTELARRTWSEALELCQRIPNVMTAQIRDRLAALSGPRNGPAASG
jgi:serine/threonine protein kinase/tetratricopeptide (TPR) repeat protein